MSDFDFNYNYIKIDAIYIFYHVFVEKRICCILWNHAKNFLFRLSDWYFPLFSFSMGEKINDAEEEKKAFWGLMEKKSTKI